jgi:lysozyme
MQPTQRVYNRLKEFEGLMLTRYQDAAGVDTIGYGHTAYAKNFDTITEDQAIDLLKSDVQKFTALVNNYRKTRKYILNQNQFDALVLFTYNLGSISKNSFLDKAIRSGDEKAAALQMLRYVYSNGQRLRGLEERRKYEAKLFVTPYIDFTKILLVAGLLL